MGLNANIKARSARTGLSIIETVISLTMLSSLIGSAAVMVTSSRSAYRQSSRVDKASADARRSVRRMIDVLSAAGIDTLFPRPGADFGTDRLAFKVIRSDQAGALSWSPVSRFRLDLDDGELDDGLDNDGDGLVDERQIVFIPDIAQPTPQEIVICHSVTELLEGELPSGEDDNGNGLIDEAGLCFSMEGEILTVRVSVGTEIGDGRVLVRTSEFSLRIKN